MITSVFNEFMTFSIISIKLLLLNLVWSYYTTWTNDLIWLFRF